MGTSQTTNNATSSKQKNTEAIDPKENSTAAVVIADDQNSEYWPYRILLIGMPSSGKKSIFNYFSSRMDVEHKKLSDVGSYKELLFLHTEQYFIILMDTIKAHQAISGNYKDYQKPLAAPMNKLHGIIFVINSNLYKTSTKGSVHETIQSILACKVTYNVPLLIYANMQDLPHASSASEIENLKYDFITPKNVTSWNNSLLYGCSLDIINVIIEYLPDGIIIPDQAIQRPLKVFGAIAASNSSKKKRRNHIKQGFKWLVQQLPD